MLARIKQFFGFVGIDVKLQIETSIPKDVQQIEGKVIVTAKATQHITAIRVRIYEERITGTDKNRDRRVFDMGKWEDSQPFDIDDGEFREFPLTLTFERTMSLSQSMSEQAGVMGFLGTVAKIADSHRGSYYVSATADVKGAALDPTDTQRVIFMS